MRMRISFRNVSAVKANLRQYARDDVPAAVRGLVKEHGEANRELAQFLAPRDTGFMAEQIRTDYTPEGFGWETGYHDEDFARAGKKNYGVYQELGTETMAAQPHLAPAHRDTVRAFKKDLGAALKRTARKRSAR